MKPGTSLVAAAAIALAFAGLWPAVHPPLVHLPTSDLYGQLSVARHLARGEGFLDDVVYPLSFAFPFAVRLPQPLIQRGPLYPLLLVLPFWAGHGDPATVLADVRWLQVLLLTLLVWIGIDGLLRRGRTDAVLPWLLLLATSPLLTMSIDWGYSEVVAALLLCGLWLRWRGGRVRSGDYARGQVPGALVSGDALTAPPGHSRSVPQAVADGFLAGLLTLLRVDLFWLPPLWWLALGRPAAGWKRAWRPCWRPAATRVMVWLLVLLPWGLRNVRLTGQPFFSLQLYAEHLKQTGAWPDYAIYRSLQPESLWSSLAHRPGLLLAKAKSGLHFFATQPGHWLPWPLWGACLLLVVVMVVRRRQLDHDHRWRAAITGLRDAPLVVILASSALLMLQYAFFSHTVRHLLVVMPVLAWEIVASGARWLELRLGEGPSRKLARQPATEWDERAARGSRRWPPVLRAALLTGAVALMILVAPPRLPGWRDALLAAEASAASVERAATSLSRLPPGPIFCDTAALLWFSGRAGVWSPRDEATKQRIRDLLPELGQAPTIDVLAEKPQERAY